MRAKSGRFCSKTTASASAACLAAGAVGVGEQVERRLERQRLAVDLEGQARHRLVEEPVPGGGADDGLVVQELLQLVRELVRLHLADAVEDRLVARRSASEATVASSAASSSRLSSSVKKTSGVEASVSAVCMSPMNFARTGSVVAW